jgi:apolipoprotein N-acyltransferase
MITDILKSKWILITGLVVLLIGILFRISIPENFIGLTLILTGVCLKTMYIIAKAQSGEYRPGFELLYLFFGLILFLSGIYLKNHNPPFKPLFLIVPGLGLKVLFIILFIRKTKKSN